MLITALAAAHLTAQLPKGAVVFEGKDLSGDIVIEAEALLHEGRAWKTADNPGASGGKTLYGNNHFQDPATATVTLPRAGQYNAWVRYTDAWANKDGSDAFTLALTQGGKDLARQTLNTTSIRTNEAAYKMWGWGPSKWVWHPVTFTAEKGDAEIALTPNPSGGNRTIDLLIITPDLDYQADITDLHPLWLKATILPEQDRPCFLTIDGRRSQPPWGLAYRHIHRGGLVNWVGDNIHTHQPPFEKLRPGDSTPWIPLHKQLTFHGRDTMTFSAMAGKGDPVANAAFRLDLSKAPSDDGIFRTETRTGPGSGMIINFNLTTGEILTDREGSAQSLAWAKATAPVEGKRPERFPFLTHMELNHDLSQGVQNELDALTLIGVSGIARNRKLAPPGFMAADGAFIWGLARNGCQHDPNTEIMERDFGNVATAAQGKNLLYLDLMDEPYFDIQHIEGCDRCAEKFRDYAAANGHPLDGKPGFDVDNTDPVRYYWSQRFRAHTMTEFFRTGTQIADTLMPGIPTTCNYSTELVFAGNMLERGSDWYQTLRTGALRYGMTEDWSNICATYQVAGYMLDVIRAACRPTASDYGIYNILPGRCAWDITAKGFCEIGHGAKSILLYNYGPYYAPTSDTASHRQDIYQAIKDLTYPTGAVEQHLMAKGARPAKGDVAMLVGTTSDIWSNPAKTGNAHGRERTYLHLLLTHCGYRTDVLDEDDLATELKNYKVLFVADSHLRAACLPPLADWVRAGGTLHLSAGALQFDEYNRPLGADTLLGLARQPLAIINKAELGENLARQKPLDAKAPPGTPPIYVGHQEPLRKATACGKGSVIHSGFFPGLSYIASSRLPDGATAPEYAEAGPDTDIIVPVRGGVYSARLFQPACRDYIRGLNLPARPRLHASNPLVEAALIESPEADVIVLSNWTGEPQKGVTVTLADAAHIEDQTVTVISGEKQSASLDKGVLSVKLHVKAGAYVLLPKKPSSRYRVESTRLDSTRYESKTKNQRG